jgi:IS30 family transposase
MGQSNHTTKRKAFKHLSEKERYKIEALVKAKHSPREIAAELKRDRRTIERELLRGTVSQRDSQWRDRPVYLADVGQRVSEENAANKGRELKIGRDHRLAKYLEHRIGKDRLSPDAAIGEIKAKGLTFTVTLCAKTVYNMIDRGDFLNLSNKDLPVKKNGKKRKHSKRRTVALNNLKGRSIEERSAAATAHEELGHWEMDLVLGSSQVCLLVMTERKSREELLFKLPNKEQKNVKAVLDRLEKKHKERFREKFKSFTTDNGTEFLDSEALENSVIRHGEKRTEIYYAHPYSSWERGSNENANKLIRRFVPKGTDIGKLTKKDIHRIQNWINNYPRKMFAYKTANDMKKVS